MSCDPLHFGIDGIWFGIILVKLVEIAVLTPPVGLNLCDCRF